MSIRLSIFSILGLALLYSVSCAPERSDLLSNHLTEASVEEVEVINFPSQKQIDPTNCMVPDDQIPEPPPVPDLSFAAARWGKGFAYSMALSPDGAYLAVGSSIGIDIYHTDTLELAWSRLTESLVTELAFSPDSQVLVSLSQFVVVWDVPTGERLHEVIWLPNSRITFSTDGSILAVTQGCTILWSTQTWEPITGLNGYADTVAFSPDGTLFVEGLYGGAAIIWDTKTGSQRYIFNEELIPEDEGIVIMEDTPIIEGIAFSADGKRLALASVVYWGGTDLSVLDAVSGEVLFHTHYDNNELGGLAFNPNGDQIAAVSSGWEGIVTIWDIESGEEIGTLTQAPNALLLDVAWSPDGATLYTTAGAFNGAWEHPITAWDAQSREPVGTIEGYTAMLLQVGWSPTGEHIVISPSNAAPLLIDPETLQTTLTLENPTGDHAFTFRWSPDGSKIAAWLYKLHASVWDTATGERIIDTDRGQGIVWGITYADYPMVIWDNSTDQLATVNIESNETLYTIPAFGESVTTRIGWSEDSRLLAWQDGETSIVVWDTQTQQPITRLNTEGAYLGDFIFSPDGTLLAVTANDGITVWNIETSQIHRRFETVPRPMQTDYVNKFAFSPDGTKIAAGYEAHQVIIWDIESGKLLHTLLGHSDRVTGVSWSPDGHQVASVSNDGTLIIWSIPD